MALLVAIMATLLVVATSLAFAVRLSPALAEPSAPLLVAEHHDVLARLEHELEVAPLNGLLGPLSDRPRATPRGRPPPRDDSRAAAFRRIAPRRAPTAARSVVARYEQRPGFRDPRPRCHFDY